MKIEVSSLSKSYYMGHHEVPVLNNVSLSLASGDFVSLTGSSGVGKSTLLHVLGTLDAPTGGTILMDGEDIFKKPPATISNFRNRHIGFVFQFHHLLPEFTALENVMMPAQIMRVAPAVSMKRAKELLDEVGLSHRMEHRPGELSGGEQQRVALARSLMNEPRLLLADEPTGNLDEDTGAEIHEMIVRLNQTRGFSVVVVTHNPRLAARMPRQLRMTKDGIVEQGQELSEENAVQ